MKLVFLGSASCFPTPTRGVSCTALQLDTGQVWLVDCGEGSQIQLQKSCIKPGKITKIFITHLHGDHLFGLPGLLCSLGNGVDPGNAEKTVIEVYGPVGIRRFISTTLGLSRSPLIYRISVIELVPRDDQYPADWQNWPVKHDLDSDQVLPQEVSWRQVEYSPSEKCWPLIQTPSWTVRAAALKHRIPSFGFQFKEASSAGQLEGKKLLDLGIKPGPIYGKLKAGNIVIFEGQTLNPKDFLGPDIPGREILIFGDTCDSDEILEISESPDAFVHEATMEESLREKCIEFGHSTPGMAAEVALKANSSKLVLFHLSPRYKPVGTELKEGDYSACTLLNEARDYLRSKGSEMEVVVAEDFMELEVPRRK